LAFLLAAGVSATAATAQETNATTQEQGHAQLEIPARHHPWGAYGPGTWKRVRVVTETLEKNGLVKDTSFAETQTTLLEVGKDSVTLRLEVVHEVAGKRFARQPQIIKQGFHGEPLCEGLQVREPRTGEVIIEGRSIPCKIFHIECPKPNGKTVTNVYYSSTVAPYVLRRTTVTTDSDGNNGSNVQMTVDVIALNMSCRVLPEIENNAAYVRAVKKHPKGIIATWTVTSTAVPGGVIVNETKEYDSEHRLIRRRSLELLDFDLKPERERLGLFRFRRPRGFRRYRSISSEPRR
jgi:hypothetical protein